MDFTLSTAAFDNIICEDSLLKMEYKSYLSKNLKLEIMLKEERLKQAEYETQLLEKKLSQRSTVTEPPYMGNLRARLNNVLTLCNGLTLYDVHLISKLESPKDTTLFCFLHKCNLHLIALINS
ncbi:unnamed protein product [Lepeophtheirus salmonis]|uniref:(salmon louse) hypothetical protein n=1 Tax=Lepeophtheirus salmonis TaxID=72036 RepID=A0A7R8CRW1_LEPSM|nr:unnamed protein product [Lepeophtheirus salmonis]CAF2910781.1 unnamed protein product [Lepeophtheirus salmonis]